MVKDPAAHTSCTADVDGLAAVPGGSPLFGAPAGDEWSALTPPSNTACPSRYLVQEYRHLSMKEDPIMANTFHVSLLDLR